MTADELLAELRQAPLIASAQADEDTPLDNPDSIVRLAQSSLREGVRVLRLQGVENIRAVRAAAATTPIIGLIKRHYEGSEPYITPTMAEVEALLTTDCEAIGIDGTERRRADGSHLRDLIARIHEAGRLALADCDAVASVRFALDCGADLISTTLAGYTPDTTKTEGPDLEFLREAVKVSHVPVFGEGRYRERWHVEAALRIGATGVVVGGALNDPVKQTQALWPSVTPGGKVGAVDLGGTWLRFGVFSSDWKLERVEKIQTPPTGNARRDWIAEQAERAGIERLGISSGGTIEPTNGCVLESKEEVIPDNLMQPLARYVKGVLTKALNDGHATAWGHACLPQFAGRRVATLALGTGVGCGFVSEGRIWMGLVGQYPRLNDLPFRDGTIESVLGGRGLQDTEIAKDAARKCISLLKSLYFPDDIVVCGGVGLSPAFEPVIEELGLHRSPFGEDAGLYGAAALALYPGWR